MTNPTFHFQKPRMPHRVCRSLIAIGFAALLAPAAFAQGHPSKPVTVLVGIGAGSTTDVLARIASRRPAERLRQPVVAENKPGAGGTIAASAVAAAPADGYLLKNNFNETVTPASK